MHGKDAVSKRVYQNWLSKFRVDHMTCEAFKRSAH